jgi:hypothetical protein
LSQIALAFQGHCFASDSAKFATNFLEKKTKMTQETINPVDNVELKRKAEDELVQE